MIANPVHSIKIWGSYKLVKFYCNFSAIVQAGKNIHQEDM